MFLEWFAARILDGGGYAWNLLHPELLFVGDGTTDNAAKFASLTPGHYQVPPGTYLIGSSITIHSDVVLEFARGAVLKPAPGVTVTLDGQIMAGRWQIFDLPDDGSDRALLTGWVRGPGLARVGEWAVEWFGAQGTAYQEAGTGPDASRYWNHAVQTIENRRGGSLTYAGRHRFSKPVIILVGGFTIKGPGFASLWSHDNPPGLYGDSGLRCIFDWGSATSTEMGMGLVFENVTARGGVPLSGAYAQRFLDVTEMWSGPRPLLVLRNCNFKWFSEAAVEVSGQGQPVVANVLFDTCEIHHCNRALWITGSRGSTAATSGHIANLRFLGSYSSQGGRIVCSGYGKITGSVVIEGNILEGQENPIILNLGYAHVRIGVNYWEGNSGTLVEVFATNPLSTVYVAAQREAGVAPYSDFQVRADGVQLVAEEVEPTKIVTGTGGLVRGSRVNGGLRVFNSASSSFASHHPAAFSGKRFAPSWASASAVAWASGTSMQTPWGDYNTDTLTGYAAAKGVTISYAAGDWLSITVPMQYLDAPWSGNAHAPYLLVTNQGGMMVGSVQAYHAAVPGSGWVLMQFMVRAAVAGTSLNMRLNPYEGTAATGTGCRVGPMRVYAAAPGSLSTFLPPDA